MRSSGKGSPGLPRLLIIAAVLGALTVVPFPVGKSAVEAWSHQEREAESDAADGAARLESTGGGATKAPEESGLAVGSSPSQQAAGDYAAGGLDGRRTNLIGLLVGMLAVLLILRWRLSVRGRQHYPRS